MAEPFLSEIRVFSFGFAPKGWALCNGQLLPINQNQALFSLLGTTYGGDGRVNFALPDLRSRLPQHMGAGFVLGQQSGEEAHTLSLAEMPAHQHGLMVSGAVASTANPSNAYLAMTQVAAYASVASGDVNLGGQDSSGQATLTGGSQAHLNMQPFLALNLCIALQGIFPSQN